MRVVVTGREGQVARSLIERAALHPSIEIIAIGRPELDLARPDTVFDAITAARPDMVVSAAAYTAVDQAEDEMDLARSVNTLGAAAVARAAASVKAPVIHLSTDYVFSGEGDKPYREEDPTGPRSIYGQTKLDGEMEVVAANPRHLILRTAWVFSPFGKNFVKTMLRLAESRDVVSVVSDQWGNPTSAIDIADAIFQICDVLGADRPFADFGTYHVAGTGSTNWSSFARTIFEASKSRQGPFAEVRDIPTSDYPTKATRPFNSRLFTKKFENAFNWRMPAWRQSTFDVVERILAESSLED
jgi:dTDP-4-dehydrorhamnose reductase